MFQYLAWTIVMKYYRIPIRTPTNFFRTCNPAWNDRCAWTFIIELTLQQTISLLNEQFVLIIKRFPDLFYPWIQFAKSWNWIILGKIVNKILRALIWIKATSSCTIRDGDTILRNKKWVLVWSNIIKFCYRYSFIHISVIND